MSDRQSPFHSKSTLTARSPDRSKTNRRQPTQFPEDRTRSQTSSRPQTPPILPPKPSEPKIQTPPILPPKPSEPKIQTPPILPPKLGESEPKTPSNSFKPTTASPPPPRPQTPSIPETPVVKQIISKAGTSSAFTPDKPQIQPTTELTTTPQTPQITLQKSQQISIPKANLNTKQAKMTQQQTQQIQQLISSSVPEFSGENTRRTTDDLFRFTATADNIYKTLVSDEEKKIFDMLIKLRLTGEAFTRISHRNIEDYPTLRDTLNKMYSKTYSLDELEKGYKNIQQSHGETVRNYGYRLLEALDQYKAGFKSKFKIQQIDAAFSEHLDINSVQTFKRGLNNTILRDKMLTSTAKNIEEIINETEVIENMLSIVTYTENVPPIPLPASYYHRQPEPVSYPMICNYCKHRNHTWDRCRIRMKQEKMRQMAEQNQQYNLQSQINRNHIQSNNMFRNSNQPELSSKQQPFRTQKNHQFNSSIAFNNTWNQQQNRNQYSPAQPSAHSRLNPQENRFAPKYCSHCKVTKGHTFDECRNKCLNQNDNQINNTINPSPPTLTDTRDLTDILSNIRINTIYPHSTQNIAPTVIREARPSHRQQPNSIHYQPKNDSIHSLQMGIIPNMYLQNPLTNNQQSGSSNSSLDNHEIQQNPTKLDAQQLVIKHHTNPYSHNNPIHNTTNNQFYNHMNSDALPTNFDIKHTSQDAHKHNHNIQPRQLSHNHINQNVPPTNLVFKNASPDIHDSINNKSNQLSNPLSYNQSPNAHPTILVISNTSPDAHNSINNTSFNQLSNNHLVFKNTSPDAYKPSFNQLPNNQSPDAHSTYLVSKQKSQDAHNPIHNIIDNQLSNQLPINLTIPDAHPKHLVNKQTSPDANQIHNTTNSQLLNESQNNFKSPDTPSTYLVNRQTILDIPNPIHNTRNKQLSNNLMSQDVYDPSDNTQTTHLRNNPTSQNAKISQGIHNSNATNVQIDNLFIVIHIIFLYISFKLLEIKKASIMQLNSLQQQFYTTRNKFLSYIEQKTLYSSNTLYEFTNKTKRKGNYHELKTALKNQHRNFKTSKSEKPKPNNPNLLHHKFEESILANLLHPKTSIDPRNQINQNTISPIINKTQPCLLLDSGADVSLIKIKYLDNISIDTQDTITLTGIDKGSVQTNGSLVLYLKLNAKLTIKHKFYTVPNDFPITEDGIIGRDFFTKFKIDILYSSNHIKISDSLIPFSKQPQRQITLSAQSETQRKIKNPSKETYVFATKIKTVNFIPHTLLQPKNIKAKIMIANTLTEGSDINQLQTHPRTNTRKTSRVRQPTNLDQKYRQKQITQTQKF